MSNIIIKDSSGADSFTFYKDTFDLKLLKRDPFLNKYFSSQEHKKLKSVKKKPQFVSHSIDRKIVWPETEYLGFIKSQNNDSPLALIQIRNKLYRMRIDQNFQGVSLQKIYEDSVKLSFEGRTQIVLKKSTK